MNRFAKGPVTLEKEFYTEQEAAETLGISVARLHLLLDENVFNDGSYRPDNIELTAADLLLLGFWNKTLPPQKVVAMPKREGVHKR